MGKVALVLGCNRGIGLAMCKASPEAEEHCAEVISGFEVAEEGSTALLASLPPIDVFFCVAGILRPETFEALDWKAEREMFEVCSIGPLRVSQALVQQNKLTSGSKIALITSEGGSIGLRTEKEGGGNYGHHMSKAAQNMMGRLLAWDLKPKGIAVVMIHPGFIRTDMTQIYKQYYEELGAVTADEAAPLIVEAGLACTLEQTGRFVAALGARGLGLGIWALPDPEALLPGGDLPW